MILGFHLLSGYYTHLDAVNQEGFIALKIFKKMLRENIDVLMM